MKNTVKLIVCGAAFIAAVFVHLDSKAQTEPGDSKATRLGIGLNLGIPTNENYNFSIGGDLRLQKDFSNNISGTLTTGYTHFSADDNIPEMGYIPLKAGLKVFPVERFYFMGELGAGFGTNHQGTAFVWSPGLGFGFNNGIDFGLRYEGYTNEGNTLGHLALRVAYGFRL